jgi:arylsulfatase A-like enzyme
MTRPNILFITADQWRGDCLGLLGHPVVKTPSLDALAQEAAVFARHYSACAPCSPARASLYTGLYQMNHRVVSNGTPLDDRFDNVARAARQAGYRPALFGYSDTALDPRPRAPRDPVLNSYEEVLPGFECIQPLREDDATWITWLAKRGYGQDLLQDPHRVPPAPDGGVSLEPPGYGPEETQTAFLVEKLLEWHGEQTGAPWFAHISFLRPHPPFVVPDPYASMVSPEDVPEPIAMGDNLQIVERVTRDLTPANGFQPGLEGSVAQLSTEDFRRLRAIYYGMVAEVDAQIGRLFDALKARGDWENTVVVFTSDHGEMLGDHGLLGKGGYYPQSQHIPLMIRVPGQGARRIDSFTSATDVFPTLLDLWGVEPTHAPDGRSLRPMMDGGAPLRDGILWEYDFRHMLPEDHREALGLRPQACHLLVLMTEAQLYVHSPAFDPLLFDLADDPTCRRRAAGENARLAMAERLLSEVTQLRDDTLARLQIPYA